MRRSQASSLPTSAVYAPAAAPPRAGLLQRKCACGGLAGFSGQCEDCGKKRLGVQRRAAGPATGFAPPIVREVLHSPGKPLDPGTRAFMEPRFGHDFSTVRVHDDSRAGKSAAAVNAHAYTLGQDIVFGPGQYRPETSGGQGLIAHELTHVMQQGRSGAVQLDRSGIEDDEKGAKELEAKRRERDTVVSREKWGARDPIKERGWDEYPKDKPLPLYRIVIHHTADPRSQTVKALQNKEMDEAHYADLPYHFVITEDGTINEGRKIEAVGAHAGEFKGNKDIKKDPDYGSIGIVVTGDFESRIENLWNPDVPTVNQLASLYKLTARLVREYKIDPANILKHSEVLRSGDPKECPGEYLAPFIERMRENIATAGKKSPGAGLQNRDMRTRWLEERSTAIPDATKVAGVSSQEIENRYAGLKAAQPEKKKELKKNQAGEEVNEEKNNIAALIKTAGSRGATPRARPMKKTFVLHDTAGLSGEGYIKSEQTRGRGPLAKGVTAWVPREAAAEMTRPSFFETRRPSTTVFERALDHFAQSKEEANPPWTDEKIRLLTERRNKLFREVWNAVTTASQTGALNAALPVGEKSPDKLSQTEKEDQIGGKKTGPDKTTGAIAQLSAKSGDIETAGGWAIEEICKNVGAPGWAAAAKPRQEEVLKAACRVLGPYFAERQIRIGSTVNVEILQHAEDTDIPDPPYTEKQYTDVAEIYLRAARVDGRFPFITTHYFLDAGHHRDPRCFNVDFLYSKIATTIGHPVDCTYGVETSYGTADGTDKVWWTKAACHGPPPK
jgi:N-acetyl-anhydromuramyl-L-alanine amidase AmpD